MTDTNGPLGIGGGILSVDREDIGTVPIQEKADKPKRNGSLSVEARSALIGKDTINTSPKEYKGACMRRLLGLRAKPPPDIRRYDSDSQSNSSSTLSIVNRVASLLGLLAKQRRTPPRDSSSSSLSSCSIAAPPSHGFGLFNRNSLRSVSSSLRELVGGKTPPNTPEGG